MNNFINRICSIIYLSESILLFICCSLMYHLLIDIALTAQVETLGNDIVCVNVDIV